MHVLSLGTDRHMFTSTSPVHQRSLLFAKETEGYHVIVFNTGTETTKSDGPLHIYPTNSLSRWTYLFGAYRLGTSIIRNIQSRDIVLTAQDPFETGLVMYLLSRTFGVPLQVQLHTDMFSPYFRKSVLNRIRLMIARFLLPRVEGIRVVHDGLKEKIEQRYKPKAQVAVLPVYVDVETLTKATAGVLPDRHQATYVVLMVSRLSREKNISLGIDVFREVLQKKPGGVLWIVGSGGEEKNLRAKVREMKLEDRVVFFGWQEDTAPFYRASDVFLSTSVFEGYGVTFVEAALLSCPVVSTSIGLASSPLFRNGQNSIVAPVGDKRALVQGILSVLDGKGVSYVPQLKRDIELTLLPQKEYTKKYISLLCALRYDPKT